MLLNPFTHSLDRYCIEHSRMLGESFELNKIVGQSILDPATPNRIWTLYCWYAPVKRRLGGLRAKFVDQKGFTTFCNQRDLELMLGLAQPGDWCRWTNAHYPERNSAEFYGFCMDEIDICDDLHAWEMQKRIEYWNQGHAIIPETFDISRRLHIGANNDVEQIDVFLFDYNPDTGMGPDPDVIRIDQRWRRSERSAVTWARL